LGFRVKKQRVHFCNVLEAGPQGQRLWIFNTDRSEARLERQHSLSPAELLPVKEVAKDWHELYQRKVNVAWFPQSQVFLRVVQLPKVEEAELLPMVEFQLEKLSPLPVAQVLWGMELVPSRQENGVTAVVCIVSRDLVEEFVGDLERRNYQPDKLEVPLLNHVLSGGVKDDGLWLYAGLSDDPSHWLAAWWSQGVLQNLQLIQVPDIEGGAEVLREQLMQTAWAGEVEGWLSAPLRWYLIADEAISARWQPLLAPWSDLPVEVSSPATPDEVARFSAARVASDERSANLLPPELKGKYRQQFVDRLWMRGIGAVVVLYTLGVIIYMAALAVLNYQHSRVKSQVANISNTYTNVLKLREQVSVMEEQLNLKYASLNCWKAASDLLPEDFSLTWLIFGSRGRTLELHGTAPAGRENDLLAFNDALRAYTMDGELLFRTVEVPTYQTRPGSQQLTWRFNSELKRSGPE
jgi:hypothetical protein